MPIDPRTPITTSEARLVELIRELQRKVEALERQMARMQGGAR